VIVGEAKGAEQGPRGLVVISLASSVHLGPEIDGKREMRRGKRDGGGRGRVGVRLELTSFLLVAGVAAPPAAHRVSAVGDEVTWGKALVAPAAERAQRRRCGAGRGGGGL
jgi:hypothetical protein